MVLVVLVLSAVPEHGSSSGHALQEIKAALQRRAVDHEVPGWLGEWKGHVSEHAMAIMVSQAAQVSAHGAELLPGAG